MNALKFTEAEIEEAKNRADLMSLVSRRVALKRKGNVAWGCCPFHKENTPSFKVENGRRRYKCFGCGAGGDAIKWLMEMERMSFVDAVAALRNDWVPQGVPLMAPKYAPKPLDDRDSRIEARRIWGKAQPAKGTVVEEYLRGRGIRPMRSVWEHVRFAPELRFGPTGDYYPAMIVQLCDNRGFCCIQRTYLDRAKPEKLKIPAGEGKFLPVKFTKGVMGGSAVRLGAPADGQLGLAEGFETSLSASQLYSLPVWSVCGASRFKSIELPREVHKLYIYGDPGEAGRTTAFEAQDFYEHHKGIEVEVIFPAADFKRAGIKDDFNNILQGELE